MIVYAGDQRGAFDAGRSIQETSKLTSGRARGDAPECTYWLINLDLLSFMFPMAVCISTLCHRGTTSIKMMGYCCLTILQNGHPLPVPGDTAPARLSPPEKSGNLTMSRLTTTVNTIEFLFVFTLAPFVKEG